MAKLRYISSVLFILIFISSTIAQELSQWRGANRDGKYECTNLLKIWPETGPEISWTSSGFGEGYSSVIVADDMIFTTGKEDTSGYVFAIDMNGKHLWKTYYGPEWDVSFPGTRTTPTYYKGKLYVHSSLGLGVCLDAKSGEIIWSEDFGKKYDAGIPKWGISEAPLIVKDMVIFTPGGSETTMLAKNIVSGKTIWESKLNGEISAYCSPILINHNGIDMILTHLEKSIVAVSPNTGELLWSFEQTNKYSVHPNTPLFDNGFVYSVTGYKEGGVMIKIAEDGKSVTEVWRNSTLDNQMGGAILIEGNIYASGHSKDRSWQCLDWKTGEVKQTSKDISKGNIIYADGLLYCYGDKGEIGILEPHKDGFNFISKTKVNAGSNQHWAHSVIHKGILYVRHGDTVIAYDIKRN